MSIPRRSAESSYMPLVLMADPNWKKGFYYDGMPPHTGMKLARRRVLFDLVFVQCFDLPLSSQKSPLSHTDLDQSGTFDSDGN